MRHTFDPEEILFCIDKVQQYLENDSNPIYINFLKASLKAFRKNYHNYDESYQVNWQDLTCILKSSFQRIEFNPNYKLVKKVQKNLVDLPEKIIVSLSGGVDSMVLLYILKNLLPNKDICVANIDYNNRYDSHLESKLAFKWAEYLNVPFKSRKIMIKRSTELRKFMKFTLEQLDLICIKVLMMNTKHLNIKQVNLMKNGI